MRRLHLSLLIVPSLLSLASPPNLLADWACDGIRHRVNDESGDPAASPPVPPATSRFTGSLPGDAYSEGAALAEAVGQLLEGKNCIVTCSACHKEYDDPEYDSVDYVSEYFDVFKWKITGLVLEGYCTDCTPEDPN